MSNELSGREQDVLRLTLEGKSSTEIAEELSISKGVAKNYLSNGIRKTGTKNARAAAKKAQDEGKLG